MSGESAALLIQFAENSFETQTAFMVRDLIEI
jgi:hypothetical protein